MKLYTLLLKKKYLAYLKYCIPTDKMYNNHIYCPLSPGHIFQCGFHCLNTERTHTI